MSNGLGQAWWRQLFFERAAGLPAVFWTALAAAGLVGAIVAGRSNSTTSSMTGNGMGTVSVKVSDPATCAAPNGPFQHVYVTISDINVNTNASAGDSDSSWVDLTPGLTKAPVQVDLLGPATNGCFLASLGDSLQLQAGSYQQIRVLLTNTAPSSNACGSSANCVVLNTGAVSPLLLSSETKTGIKIPSGQIANGGFTIAAGQTKDLDIDFNTCVSIVQEGNGAFRLKPVLHAGEVSTTSTSINGTVEDSGTGKAITGPAIVALEQKDGAGIDRVFMSTLTDASGNFVFCPLPSGTYDVVIVGKSGAGVVYSPTVVTGVSPGSAMGMVPMHALPVVSVGAATLTGVVTSQTGASAATSADVQLSTLEAVSSTLTVTVPLLPTATQSSAVLALETASGGSCPTGTDCVSYSVQLPAGAAFVGTFSTSISVTQSSLAAAYMMDGIASLPGSGGATDCSPGEEMTTGVTPVVAVSTAAPTLKFGGCS